MKNVLRIVLLMLVGGILSGYISSATSTSYLDRNPFNASENTPAPKVVFPVAGKKARIGSFWGAIRDGGTRKHEGIDIFAAKKTPVVAVKDGIVTTIGNGGRGGKYVWLKSFDDEFTYYYAHLDQQLVKPGQTVTAGQIIGTVGNTGNAKLTPPHLHFGMYSYTGAVDPLPFVKKLPRLPVTASTNKEVLAQTQKAKQPASPISPRFIWKKIYVPADPAGKYYVTTRSNVVRVQNEQLAVIGKYEKQQNSTYPYRIVLKNKQQLMVSAQGKIVTSNGRAVGEVI